MKRSISLILSMLLLFTFILPVSALEGYDKELENAIKKAKTLFDTTQYDKFESYINSYSSTVEYYLRWYDSKEKLGGMEVTIDSDGMVRNYYKYNYNEEMGTNTFPKVSKEEGLKAANEFLKKINPELYSKVKYEENNEPLNIYDRMYYYNYYRVENGIPFYQNNIYLSVNNKTGEVQSYGCYWDKVLKFDDKDNIIGIEAGQKAFIEKIGLKLVYKLDYSNREYKPYVVYTSLDTNKAIDAKTGEPVSIYSYYRYAAGEEMTKDSSVANDSGEIVLSPEELDAIDKMKDIISKEEAEKTARQLLNISTDYKLDGINLYNDWYNKNDHTWNMYFSNKDNSNISVTIDAKNKELKSFYRYNPYLEKETVKYTKDQLQKKAEDFIKKVQGDKFNIVELVEINEPIVRPLLEGEEPRQYYFTFTRKVKDAYFPGNGFSLNLDAATGEITSYNYSWYKGQLPSTDKVMSLEKAYGILFREIGMELQYIGDSDHRYFEEYGEQGEAKNAKLVYSIKQGKPLNIDPFTGELLYGLGRPYKESDISQYKDIEDSFAKMDIEALAKYGISFPGDKFNPKEGIKQKDLLYLMLKAKGYYYDLSYEDKDFIEKLYRYLVRESIIKENEKSPEAIVTREEATKFIVRALGYDKVASIEGIYSLSFKDADKITKDLKGHVAIATGLGILQGYDGNFNPKTNLTREQAAVVVFNYLNVK